MNHVPQSVSRAQLGSEQEGPYQKLIERLREIDPHCRYRLGNRYILEEKDIGPRSCVETWLTPNGRVFVIQRWADTPGFEYYVPTKDDHTIEAAVKLLIEYGMPKEELVDAASTSP